MFKLSVSNNIDRYSDLFDETVTTPRDAANKFGIELAGKAIMMNGVTLKQDDLDREFVDLGVSGGHVTFTVIDKLVNA